MLDTSILVAALRSGTGASRQLLVAALEGRYALVLSVPLVLEYEAVLTRPENLEAANLALEDVRTVLDALCRVGEPTRLEFLWRPALRDPDDDMVLETAVNGQAELLVTLNQRDFSAAERRLFDLSVCTPREALAHLREQS